MNNTKKLCIIGRNLKCEQLNTLYEVLEDNKEDLSYETYEINGLTNWENKYKIDPDEYDAFLFIGTKPKFEDKIYTRISIPFDETTIITAINYLSERLFPEIINDLKEEIDFSNIDEDTKQSSMEKSFNHTFRNTETLNISQKETLIESNTKPLIQDYIPLEPKFDTLKGIKIEVLGKEIYLDKEDSEKFTELVNLCERQNFKIISVELEND